MQLGIADAATTGQSHLEYEVKAAFLYNFAKFVEWPRTAFVTDDAPLVFCIVGRDPFDGSLEHIVDGRTANGRRIDIRDNVNFGDANMCHLAFVPQAEDERMARIVHAFHSDSGGTVLTIGETDRFAQAGGMIRLIIDEGRVRFDVNIVSAERAGLKVSSQLLKLARKVER